MAALKLNLDKLLDEVPDYKNLLNRFNDHPKFGGYGLIGSDNRSEKVDKIFDEVCQEMELPLDICFEFANSKPGRWAGDDLDRHKTPAAIKKVFKWYIHLSLTDKDPWLRNACPDWQYNPKKIPKPMYR